MTFLSSAASATKRAPVTVRSQHRYRSATAASKKPTGFKELPPDLRQAAQQQFETALGEFKRRHSDDKAFADLLGALVVLADQHKLRDVAVVMPLESRSGARLKALWSRLRPKVPLRLMPREDGPPKNEGLRLVLTAPAAAN